MLKPLDIFLIIILLGGGYSGFRKGFIMEFFSIGSLFLATIGSVKILDRLATFYAAWYKSLGGLTPYVIFVLLFIMIVFAVTLVGKFIRNLISLTLLGSIDRIIGTFLGIYKWGFFMSIFVWLGKLLHLQLPHTYTANTVVFPMVEMIAPQTIDLLTPWLPMLQERLTKIKLYKR